MTTADPSPRPGCSTASDTAGTAAKIEPSVGMKLNMNATTPHRSGKSSPMIATQVPMTSPVAALTAAFVTR